MELKDPLNTRTTRKGDVASLEITTEVFAERKIVIPRGSRVRATVTQAKRPGRIAGKARIRLQFDTLTLPDGTSYPISTQLTPSGWWEPTGDIKQRGDSARARDLKQVGTGAMQGAVIGVLLGGRSGAAKGAAAGAGATAIAVLLERGPELDLPPGMMFEVQLTKPLTMAYHLAEEQRADTSLSIPPATPSGAEPASEPLPPAPEAATPPGAPQAGPAETAEVHVPSAPQEPPQPAAPATPPISNDEISGAYTLQVKVNLVLVEATVRDSRGQIVDNLTKDDFTILEDGAAQTISHFSRDELPLAVAIVVDRSGSVEPILQRLREAALDTLSLLKPDDQVCLFAFDSRSERLEYLTTDRERIANAIARIRSGGGTNITDAVFDAALYLGRAAPSRRHAIVLVSDNQETVRGFASAGDAVRLGLETETTIYSIRITPSGLAGNWLAPDLIPGANAVNKMARETGGEVFQADDGRSIKMAMSAVINRLKKRYTLGYVSSNPHQDGKFREISVKISSASPRATQNVRVFARRGYYAPLARTATAKTP